MGEFAWLLQIRKQFLSAPPPWEDKGRRLVSFRECGEIFCEHTKSVRSLSSSAENSGSSIDCTRFGVTMECSSCTACTYKCISCQVEACFEDCAGVEFIDADKSNLNLLREV